MYCHAGIMNVLDTDQLYLAVGNCDDAAPCLVEVSTLQ